MLTAGQLASMRGYVARMLPDSVGIYTRSETVDSAGNVIPTMTLASTVAGRLDPDNSQNEVAMEAGQEYLGKPYILTLPYDASIVKNAQVVINSKTYEVISIHDAHSWRVSVRCKVVQIV
jgi:head-tail adaptor